MHISRVLHRDHETATNRSGATPDSSKVASRITYYASVTQSHDRTDPAGLVRRIHTEPVPTDEALHRDLEWHPTEALYLYWLGHTDNDYVEITEEEANHIIAGWQKRFS